MTIDCSIYVTCDYSKMLMIIKNNKILPKTEIKNNKGWRNMTATYDTILVIKIKIELYLINNGVVVFIEYTSFSVHA